MTMSSKQVADRVVMPVASYGAGWFVKRALFGILVLTAAMGCFAWLTYTSLEAADADSLSSPRVVEAE